MKVEDFKVGERVHDIGWGSLMSAENGEVVAITGTTVTVKFDQSSPFDFIEGIDLDCLAHGEFVEPTKEEA